jgi:CRISPR type IV-associated protein Csf2
MTEKKEKKEEVKMIPTQKYLLNGFIRLTSPLHIASPEEKRYDPAHDRFAFGGGNATVTGIQKMKLPKAVEYKRKNEKGEEVTENFQPEIPVIAGNNLNGRLRRIATQIVLEKFREKKLLVNDLHVYSGMTCGAVTGKPEGSTILFDEYRKYRNHVFVGIFGGGPRMLRRNARIHNSIPVTADTLNLMYSEGSPARHPGLSGVENSVQDVIVPPKVSMTQVWLFNRKDDLEMLTDVDLLTDTFDGYVSKVRERQKMIVEEKEKLRAKGKGENDSKTTTRTYSCLEFVIPGINFPLTVEMDLNEAQVGLYLLSLERFTQRERLGGIVRNGFGCFNLENVCLTTETGDIIENIFVGGQLDRHNPKVKKFIDACQKSLDELNVEELEWLYRLPVPKKTKADK